MTSASAMMNDVTSAVNPTIASNLIAVLDISTLSNQQKEVLFILNSWDGAADLNSVASTVYHRWIYFFLKNTFKDELGEDRFNQLLGTHFIKRVIAPMSGKNESVWWDDLSTDSKESRIDIVNKSFLDSYAALETSLGTDYKKWTWDKVHTIEHPHPIGQIEALRSYFNVGPFPINGTREVINNLSFNYSEDGLHQVSSGPSTRRVIDFSDIENSISILPTGQSGNMFSPHYDDQAQMFVNGEFRKMMMNKEEIQRTSKSVLKIKLLK
jgi:penicillin amidase